MSIESLEKILAQEFICYYHADLLPVNWHDNDVIKSLSTTTSGRLKVLVEDKSGLIELLNQMRNKREHALNKRLSEETDIEWCIEDDDWDAYEKLIGEIISGLVE